MLKFSFLDKWTPQIHGLLRIVVGFMFLCHGSAKLLGMPHVEGLSGVPLVSLMGLAGVLELGGGLLVMVGLFTKPVAFILSGEMAVAYFKAHFPGGWLPLLNHGEAAAFYSWVFLFFAAAGGGAFQLESLVRKR